VWWLRQTDHEQFHYGCSPELASWLLCLLRKYQFSTRSLFIYWTMYLIRVLISLLWWLYVTITKSNIFWYMMVDRSHWSSRWGDYWLSQNFVFSGRGIQHLLVVEESDGFCADKWEPWFCMFTTLLTLLQLLFWGDFGLPFGFYLHLPWTKNLCR